ncbi:hypothetical protein FQZ97_990010 [compost metagenome]
METIRLIGNSPPIPKPSRQGQSRPKRSGDVTSPMKPPMINSSSTTRTSRRSLLRLAMAGVTSPEITSMAVRKPRVNPALCSDQPCST